MDRRVKDPGTSSTFDECKELIAVSAVGGLTIATRTSITLGEALYADVQQEVPWNPIALAINLATGQLHWTGAATGGAVTLAAAVAAGAAGSVWGWRAACRKCSQLAQRRGERKEARREAKIAAQEIDAQARYMADGRELADLHRNAILKKATQLGVQMDVDDAPGVMVARNVVDGATIYGSYEDLHLDIWGPRSGKSTSRVIPAVIEAIGAVVATSNKRDVVDATREIRSERGETHVFDPQGVAEEECTWFWDPIAWVAGDDGGRGAQVRAAMLAAHFASGGDADSRDAFFDPEGEGLLAGLILAAALAKRPITQVFAWVTKHTDQEPIDIVASGGYELVAGALSDQYNAPDKQRSGIFSTAKKMAGCLQYAHIAPWVCPPTKKERPRREFKVADFVRSRDTLYPLSKEGPGSGGPLVAALCEAITFAGADLGTRYPGGRMPVPLLVVLDEAANIVKWRDLPKQYSHFGSRGIVVMTVLQSWAQGVRCWGPEGMTALWSAANIKVLGAGLDDAGFLRDRSELIGPHYELTTSVSKSKGQGPNSRSQSVSTSRTSEVTLHASDLAALPKGRVVVFISGHKPMLGATVPWMARPYAPRIRAALDAIATAAQAPRPVLFAVPNPDQEGKSA
ncbi:type IV secretory system conjugative DNA transfer family protein [Nocardia brasiliensis]|uniref:type IV secretory system conjugative DNA transfer family protein n=1 Tax=Nocardia brasiliensis TaxID=37326 RepID=UPI00068EFCA3|nr:TraM recognition domain-containing protein [Nocardia brasiliensis]